MRYKEIKYWAEGKNGDAFLIFRESSNTDVFGGKGVQPIIPKISEFLTYRDIARVKHVSKNTESFEYGKAKFEGILTNDVLTNITKQQSIKNLKLHLDRNIERINPIDLTPLQNLKRLEYKDIHSFLNIIPEIGVDTFIREKTELIVPNSVEYLNFISGNTILHAYPSKLKQLVINVNWHSMNENLLLNDFQLMRNLKLPTSIESITVTEFNDNGDSHILSWLNNMNLTDFDNLHFLSMSDTPPENLVIPKNLLELRCGPLVSSSTGRNQFPEMKSFSSSSLKTLFLQENSLIINDPENSIPSFLIPESKDFEFPTTLEKLYGSEFRTDESVMKLKPLVNLKYLRCSLMPNISVLVSNVKESLLQNLYILYEVDSDFVDINSFFEQIANLTYLKELEVHRGTFEGTGEIIRNSSLEKLTIHVDEINDEQNPEGILLIDFSGFEKLEILKISYPLITPTNLNPLLKKLILFNSNRYNDDNDDNEHNYDFIQKLYISNPTVEIIQE